MNGFIEVHGFHDGYPVFIQVQHIVTIHLRKEGGIGGRIK